MIGINGTKTHLNVTLFNALVMYCILTQWTT